MEKKQFTCIVCPMGCKISVALEDNKVVLVLGNRCPRGKAYVEKECIAPERTVTSTVRCTDGGVVPVKTDGTIPKEKIFECMQMINNTIIPLPVSIGDVIIDDVFGCRVVATDNR